MRRSLIIISLIALGAAIAALFARARARIREANRPRLPGDDVLPGAKMVATRSIDIDADPEEVWGWIAQIGQHRAGFYSFTELENALGCEMPEEHRIVPEWQTIEVGDHVHLAPEIFLKVEQVEPNRHLVLRSDPEGAPPDHELDFEFTWAFVLEPTPYGTRLTARERYEATSAKGKMESLAGYLGSSIMSRKMLSTIKELAEGA